MNVSTNDEAHQRRSLQLIEICYECPTEHAVNELRTAEQHLADKATARAELSNLCFVVLSFEEASNLRQIIRLGRPHLPSDKWRKTAEALFERIGEARDGMSGKFLPFRPTSR